MKKAIPAVLLLAGLSAAAYGQVPEAEWQQFKAEFAAMSARIAALEAENRALRERSGAVPVENLDAVANRVAAVERQNEASSWSERVRWKGDIRYRYEEIEEQGRDDRDRNRIRARAALVAKTSDTTEVGLGMASGGDDPVSTNQTLGGGGSTKDLRLDLAYLTWTGLENTYVTAGKFANPFYLVEGSGLVWDGDFRPEGVALGWHGDTFFATTSYSFLESDSSEDDDAFWGVQLGARFNPFGDLLMTTSAKYLDIPTSGRQPFDDDFFGNSSVVVDGEEVYALDYHLVNLSLDLSFALMEMPVSLYGDYVNNDEADDLDTGYLAGVRLGSTKKQGDWLLQYQYQDLEADATLGLITDSDFAGGGTDGEGHRLNASYAIHDNWYVGATYYDTTRGQDLGSDADYKRLVLDTGIKY